jgi:hypothetical protein
LVKGGGVRLFDTTLLPHDPKPNDALSNFGFRVEIREKRHQSQRVTDLSHKITYRVTVPSNSIVTFPSHSSQPTSPPS